MEFEKAFCVIIGKALEIEGYSMKKLTENS